MAGMADLDRCVHGRHSIDNCWDCPDQQSAGNPYAGATVGRVGTAVGGLPLYAADIPNYNPADVVGRRPPRGTATKEHAMFINLTPHAVVILGEDGTVLADIPPSGTVARLTETASPSGRWVMVGPDEEGSQRSEAAASVKSDILKVTLGEITGLPKRKDGVVYIGSMPLLMGASIAGIEREDLVYPHGQVRDDAGRIIGCRSLARLA